MGSAGPMASTWRMAAAGGVPYLEGLNGGVKALPKEYLKAKQLTGDGAALSRPPHPARFFRVGAERPSVSAAGGGKSRPARRQQQQLFGAPAAQCHAGARPAKSGRCAPVSGDTVGGSRGRRAEAAPARPGGHVSRSQSGAQARHSRRGKPPPPPTARPAAGRAGGYPARMAPDWFAFVGLFLLGALALGGALVMVVNFDRNEARKRAERAERSAPTDATD